MSTCQHVYNTCNMSRFVLNERCLQIVLISEVVRWSLLSAVTLPSIESAIFSLHLSSSTSSDPFTGEFFPVFPFGTLSPLAGHKSSFQILRNAKFNMVLLLVIFFAIYQTEFRRSCLSKKLRKVCSQAKYTYTATVSTISGERTQ